MRILMIGAHQDDNEFRCGGLASKYVKLGHDVYFLSVANGCGGHHIMSPEETTATRAKESAAVAKLLGITYDIWDIPDCNVVADLPTRKRMIRYIRNINPDLIITHRTNDYHADHRATAQLVQDASYLLTVPNECPDAPAMRYMPVIMYNEDHFQYPPFEPNVVLDMDEEIDVKLKIADLNVCQVYEWLPYTYGTLDQVPTDKAERFEWLKGANITAETTDEEVLAGDENAYAIRYAQTAALFRDKLIERYGKERGSKIRYAEAFQISEYGKQPDEAFMKELFPF